MSSSTSASMSATTASEHSFADEMLSKPGGTASASLDVGARDGERVHKKGARVLRQDQSKTFEPISQRQRKTGYCKRFPTDWGESSAALRRERLSIARELHDQVMQELILTVMSLRRLALPESSTMDETPLLQATAAASRALSNARKFLRDLRAREYPLDSLELESPVRFADVVLPVMALAEATTHVEVQIASMKDVVLSARVAREVDKILREAVLNAQRHSGARVIVCRASSDAGRIILEVADNGCGFEPCNGVQGFGLLGMAERARVLGATLQVRSRPDRGTVVRLQLTRSPGAYEVLI
jgi:signal transduction histidine kinase